MIDGNLTMAQIRLSHAARKDLKDIGKYIARDNKHAAKNVLAKFQQAFDLLAENPGIGHQREDLTEQPFRFWSVFSYLIVYEATNEDALTVVRILHGYRDVENILD